MCAKSAIPLARGYVPSPLQSGHVATRNFGFEKRQKEQAREQKKQEKARRKEAARREAEAARAAAEPVVETPPESPQ